MNIILIGMPCCGKSTCGVLAAKALCMSFLDTDLLIQQNEGMKLNEILSKHGVEYFEKCEERSVSTLYARNCVIATGGSMVYSDAAMSHLKENGFVVFLDINYPNMARRLKNLKKRGVVLKDGFTLRDMYNERRELYLKYADAIVDCNGNAIEETVNDVIKACEVVLQKKNC